MKDKLPLPTHEVRIKRLERLVKRVAPPGTGPDGCLDTSQLLDLTTELGDYSSSDRKAGRRLLQMDLKRLVKDGRIEVANPGGKPLKFRRPNRNLLDDALIRDDTLKQVRARVFEDVEQRELTRLWQNLMSEVGDGPILDAQRLRIVPDTLRLQPVELYPNVLTEVLTALVNGQALDVKYRNAKGEVSEPRLHPQALVLRGPIPYLYALKNDEDEPVRLYALQRMTSAQVRPEIAARQAEDFDLDEAIADGSADFGPGDWIDLELLARGYLARVLLDCPLEPDQICTNEPGGAAFEIRVRACVPSTGQLLRWLLGAGDNVEVVAPPELRETLASQALKMAGIYGKCLAQDGNSNPG